MPVHCISSLDELAPYADDWDRLSAGVPFRSWAWMSTWWKHYGASQATLPGGRRLCVQCVFDHGGQLIGLAPWYFEAGSPAGRVIRMLGSGEAASDYLSLLCRPGAEDRVARVVADRLTQLATDHDGRAPRWDLLELDGVDAADHAVNRMVEYLARRGNAVHRRPGPGCWRIALPRTWPEYLAMLSKGHRKQIRRLQRSLFDTGRAALRSATRLDELSRATDLLVDLHRRRRQARGEPGRFVSERFTAFHREVMPQMLLEGRLQLSWLELDGRPVAAEYHLAGNGVVYAYQSGIDPECLDRQPGRLIMIATLRRAIEQGYRAFDLLRGDEPYKAHYRAEPRSNFVVRVVPDRMAARLRHRMWLTGHNVKQWIRNRLKRRVPCLAGNDSF